MNGVISIGCRICLGGGGGGGSNVRDVSLSMASSVGGWGDPVPSIACKDSVSPETTSLSS